MIAGAYLPALTPVTQIDGKQLSQALTVNFLATQALIANFDPLLKRADAGRVIGLTSSVGAAPRAYWSAYGATKAAFDNLLESYAQEVEKVSKVRVAVIDPGATRTDMRAKAYPGEDPKTVKDPAVVADRLVELLVNDFDGCHRERELHDHCECAAEKLARVLDERASLHHWPGIMRRPKRRRAPR